MPEPAVTPTPQTPPATVPLGTTESIATYRDAKKTGATEIPNPALAKPVEAPPPVETDPDVDEDTQREIDQIAKPVDNETPAQKAARTKANKVKAEKAIKTRLANQRDDARRRADAAEAELARTRQAPPPTTSRPETAGAQPPAATFPSFDQWLTQPGNDGKDYELYRDARDDWKSEQRALADHASRQRDQAGRDARTRGEAHQRRVAEFTRTTPDYDAVVRAQSWDVHDGNRAAAIELATAVEESEHGPKLAYHFATHPDEFAGLLALPPKQAVYRLAQVEARITAPPPAPPPTAAPAPHVPVAGSGVPASTKSAGEINSTAEYRSRRAELLHV